MIDDQAFTNWVDGIDATRCVLVEVLVNISGIETTRYFSTTGYITGATDTPANTPYDNIVVGGAKFTESLDIDSTASLSFGDIELSNASGELDDWLNDVWVNRPIQIYVGDVRWDRSDFRKQFDGIVDDIDSNKNDTLKIKIKDKLQRLNTPVTETVIGGTGVNKDNLKPILLGECFNLPAVLVDAATLEYQLHDGAMEGFIEVRDNGIPISITDDSANGKFKLIANPAGVITASGQGYKVGPYENTISKLVEILATEYGNISQRFTATDIDSVNFSDFDIANPQPVGIFISNRTNVLTAINDLAVSVGAQALPSREGKLRLLKIEFPPAGTPKPIGVFDIQEGSLKISERVPVQSAIKIGFNKNWTPQPDLLTGIPQEHKEIFAEEWISKTASDVAVATDYKLDNEPVQKDTMLLVEADASAEATRQLTIFKTPRTIYEFDGFASLIELELGDAVTLTHNRFGLSAGVLGMVVKIQIDWINFTAKIAVIV